MGVVASVEELDAILTEAIERERASTEREIVRWLKNGDFPSYYLEDIEELVGAIESGEYRSK